MQSNCFKFLRTALEAAKSELFGPSDSWLLQQRDSHRGETCFVLGNGPSLREIPDHILQYYPSFGTNGIFLRFIPTYFVTISVDFYRNHIETIRQLQCRRKFIGNKLVELIGTNNETVLNCSWNVYGNLFGWNFPAPLRFSSNPSRVVYLGGTVLFVCLQLAYWMGFQRVILLGVDHRFGFARSTATYVGQRVVVKGEDTAHFHPNYNPPGHVAHCDMLTTENAFRIALNAFRSNDRELINATSNTGLDVIPKANLGELLQ